MDPRLHRFSLNKMIRVLPVGLVASALVFVLSRCSPLSPSITKRITPTASIIENTTSGGATDGEDDSETATMAGKAKFICSLSYSVLLPDCFDKKITTRLKYSNSTPKNVISKEVQKDVENSENDEVILIISRESKNAYGNSFQDFVSCDPRKEETCRITLVLNGFSENAVLKPYFKVRLSKQEVEILDLTQFAPRLTKTGPHTWVLEVQSKQKSLQWFNQTILKKTEKIAFVQVAQEIQPDQTTEREHTDLERTDNTDKEDELTDELDVWAF